MSLPVAVAVFIISIFLLIKSGSWSVRSVSRIAAFMQLSQFIVSFIIVGFITSLPEIFVSINAALDGDSVLAFGNNIGSNILYPTLLIGIVVIAAGQIFIKRNTFAETSVYASLISLVPFALMLDLELSRFEGVVLIIIFIWYFVRLLNKERVVNKIYESAFNHEKGGIRNFFKELFILIGSLVLLIASAEFIVRSATVMAAALDFPLVVIGIFLVAIGVALPELIFGVKSIMANSQSMIMGNLFGSLVINSGLALGIAAVISPIVINNAAFFWISAFFAAASLIIFGIFSRSRYTLSWKEGIFLIFIYMIFTAAMFSFV